MTPADEANLDECSDIIEALQKLADGELIEDHSLNIEGFGGDATIVKGSRIPQLTFIADSKSVNLSEALKVHVSYKREEDKSLTLYFNYMNYFDTPYVKIQDNKPVPDTIDGTYLKLKAGEEGTLDIVV